MSHEFDRVELLRHCNEYERCQRCGGMAEHLHHAISRKEPYTDSLFNATRLCAYCNIEKHGEIHKYDVAKEFIKQNMRRLMSSGARYKQREVDTQFINWHREASDALRELGVEMGTEVKLE
ncbi:MAG: hypothetical protein KAT71_08245 [Gammaproteobacteria bacterium]|nr:hypothetical protein [Gammaproteobacteria bacterium]